MRECFRLMILWNNYGLELSQLCKRNIFVHIIKIITSLFKTKLHSLIYGNLETMQFSEVIQKTYQCVTGTFYIHKFPFYILHGGSKDSVLISLARKMSKKEFLRFENKKHFFVFIPHLEWDVNVTLTFTSLCFAV